MALIDVYNMLLTGLGFVVTDDNYIKLPRDITDKDSPTIQVLVDNKPLVLPVREHISTAVEHDASGKATIIKIPFNPFREDVLKGDSLSLKKLKNSIEHRLSHTFFNCGLVLLTLSGSKELQNSVKLSLKLSKFLKSLQEAKTVGVKHLIDDATMTNWINIHKNRTSIGKGLLSLYIAKPNGRSNVKFCRTATLTCPLLEELEKANKETKVFNVTLRNKDITIFTLICKFLLEELDKDNTIKVVSEDNIAPATISVYKLYYKLAKEYNSLLDSLRGVDENVVDSGRLPIDNVDITVLDNLDVYKGEINLIPSDTDLVLPPALATNPIQPQPIQPQVAPIPQQPVVPAQQDIDPVHRALYGGARPQSIAPVQPIIPPANPGFPIHNNNMFGQPVAPIQPLVPVQHAPAPGLSMGFQQTGYAQPIPYQHYNPSAQFAGGLFPKAR